MPVSKDSQVGPEEEHPATDREKQMEGPPKGIGFFKARPRLEM